jgi:3-oxoacyl-(acyl-carrier-protein) synthase/acyl carrier protein
MLNLLNQYCHDYVSTPIIEACREHGLFKLLDTKRYRKISWLIENLGVNAGYFAVVLQTLESLGWVEKNKADAYRLTKSENSNAYDLNLTWLYAVDPEQLLREVSNREMLCEKIEQVFFGPQNCQFTANNIAYGALILPLVICLKELNPDKFCEELNQFDTKLVQTIKKLFVSQGWLTTDKSHLTTSGHQLLQSTIFDIAASHRAMLHTVDDLLFVSKGVDAKNYDIEKHKLTVNSSNVIASGLQHEKYFEDLQQKIINIFDQRSLDQQPQIIVNVGCGDGVLLKRLLQTIYELTARGKNLKELPLTVLAVDDNIDLLNKVAENLSGIEHQTLIADIHESEKINSFFKENGIGSDQRVLQIRTFVGNRISKVHQQLNDESLEIIAKDQPSNYLDNQAELLDTVKVLEQWKQYQKSLINNIANSELLILEAHGIPNQHVCKKLDRSDNFYFDCLHSLSHQYLISAEAFMLVNASVGLFNQSPVKRYPTKSTFCRASLNELCKRDYIVRFANGKDLPILCELEEICWQHLKSTKQQISSRLRNYPQGQFVLEKDGHVVGVIYSQRINDVSALDESNASNVHKLHDESGSIIQLLAVNIHPDVQNLNLGDQLLEFMLQRCSVMNGIDKVVGVTLCKKFKSESSQSFEKYIHERDRYGASLDPVLSFHDYHGAEIVKPLPGYRVLDIENEGNGVLVEYEIQERINKLEKRAVLKCEESNHKNTSKNLKGVSQEKLEEFLQTIICTSLGDNKESFAMEHPLMEMGLDSSTLLQLTRQIREKYKVVIQPTFFFQYNTTQKVLSALTEKLNVIKELPVANLSDKKNIESKEEDKVLTNKHLPFEDIAIIGMSCRLPGNSNRPEDLWDLLSEGGCGITTLPEGRFSWPDKVAPSNNQGLEYGGFIKDISSFDAGFFRISPKEAKSMDPQQRIALELAWHCFENSGLLPHSSQNKQTGVFIGASGSDYSKLLQEAKVEVDAYCGTGSSMAVLANRISYFFDFSGPSIQVDTACSASLTAVHTAIQSLKNNECEQALVGGIHLICHPANSLAYYRAGMLATDGKCKSFDVSANGYVRSEGAVMLLLKPLGQAVADQDQIHAILKGSAINHGGLSGGLTVPSPQNQAQLLIKAWQNAKIDPHELTYLEAHGTGTSLGDPIEIQGMKEAFALSNKNRPYPENSCGVGSLKSNLGHLEAAAGIAGLLKVVLSMKQKQIPASINFKKMNPEIKLESSPLYISKKLEFWAIDSKQKRLAGVSSFGSGGANAHVVVEGWEPVVKMEIHNESYLLVVSAKNKERLYDYVSSLICWINSSSSSVSFADFIYTYQVGRTFMDERLAIKASNFQDLQSRLKSWIETSLTNDAIWQNNPKQVDMNSTSSLKYIAESEVLSSVTNGDLSKLAQMWTTGATIDFSALYKEQPSRVIVPNYPFSKEEHWFLPADNKEQPISLIGREMSSGDGTVFSKSWNSLSANFYFTQDSFTCLSLGFILQIFLCAGEKTFPDLEIVSIKNFKYYPYQLEKNSPFSYETRCSIQGQEVMIELVHILGNEQILISQVELVFSEINSNQFTDEEMKINPQWINLVEDKNDYQLPLDRIKSLFPVLLNSTTSSVIIPRIIFYPSFKTKEPFMAALSPSEVTILTESKQPLLSIYYSGNEI